MIIILNLFILLQLYRQKFAENGTMEAKYLMKMLDCLSVRQTITKALLNNAEAQIVAADNLV